MAYDNNDGPIYSDISMLKEPCAGYNCGPGGNNYSVTHGTYEGCYNHRINLGSTPQQAQEYCCYCW